MDYLYAVVLFAISASVTRGRQHHGDERQCQLRDTQEPAAAHGDSRRLHPDAVAGRAGFRPAVYPLPGLHFAIKCIGTLDLLYLAWLIARSADEVTGDASARPLGFLKGALFQWVNAKAWVVATGAIAAFTSAGGRLPSAEPDHSPDLLHRLFPLRRALAPVRHPAEALADPCPRPPPIQPCHGDPAGPLRGARHPGRS